MVLAYLSMILLMVVGILLMIVILLQRGRGGGLAGAFGGAGGGSAFGTRAGDVFTKITAIMAIVWVVLAGASRFALESAQDAGASEHFESDVEEPGVSSVGDGEEEEVDPGSEPPEPAKPTDDVEPDSDETPAPADGESSGDGTE
ncbi:preprotein translocase subunit SecG [Thalassoroseus pseudoceratinae]|uniref:preprotein translocase subunit SecG n=1 Tax=Thalassoroseus pseudoceratinae TaxID=2713176 RepID=UPI00141F2D88|nr:preprotein translocase subunit SecG [Thalassoroseus pseudoceratinae]